MTYQYILFDLDGTITKSGIGIINSVEYALHKMGVEIEDREILKKFIGPPLSESFQTIYKMSPEEAECAVRYYREYYSEKGIFENEVYDGFIDTLKKLKAAGKSLAVATSKPEQYAKKIAERFGFSKYFDKICGATMDDSRSRKADVIRYTIDTLGLEEKKEQVLMVGDRENDICGAKENGLASMGVLYGYGSQSELEKAGADYIAESTAKIAELVLSIES